MPSPLSADAREQLCHLSRPAHAVTARLCEEVDDACLDAEQVLLYSADAASQAERLYRLLSAADLFDLRRPLLPRAHRTVLAAAPREPYDYIPLAINAQLALRSHANVSGNRFARRRLQPAGRPAAAAGVGLLFITAWSNAWQETAHRALPHVFEAWCHERGGVTVVPAMWGATAPRHSAAADAASARTWLGAFSAAEVWTLGLMPTPEPVQQQLFGNRPCDAACLGAYAAASDAFFAARGARCFGRLRVCNFQQTPAAARPWSAMQALAAYHAGMPANATLAPRLSAEEGTVRVLFVVRATRRRVENLDELVGACARWRPRARADAPRVECAARGLGAGVKSVVPLLRAADVLFGVHGGDLINGLMLHAGASVVEVLPLKRAGCPCETFKRVFASEPGKVFHYVAKSDNMSFLRGRNRGMHSDMVVPVEVVERALERVIHVQGDPRKYRFHEIRY
ncbi:hypothetical protein AB1Y20_006931 [Prymnesium parvum]|uniref:Uncharacterized protein n=1 Tax=Prymnesium parvum TaxID=97485 RepID=A0AB34J194_PRYPA